MKSHLAGTLTLFIATAILAATPAARALDAPSKEAAAQTGPATGQDSAAAASGKPTKADDREQPIHISADRIEINQKKSTTVYIGRVSFIQGGLRINAARAEARYKGDKIDTVIATGKPVTLYQRSEEPGQDLQGWALRLEYHALDNKLDLFNEVRLQQGTSVVQCTTLHYNLADSTLNAEGDGGEGRVTVAIEPKKNEPGAAPDNPPAPPKRKPQ